MFTDLYNAVCCDFLSLSITQILESCTAVTYKVMHKPSTRIPDYVHCYVWRQDADAHLSNRVFPICHVNKNGIKVQLKVHAFK